MILSKMRIAIYIDGSNFYFSIKKAFQYKVDIEKFCKKLVGDDQLVKINFYIASVDKETNPEAHAEQQKFFDILNKIDKLNIVFGRLEKRKADGKIYYVEKATDINLALDLVLDAFDNKCDKTFLISNDGDFSGAVSAVIKRFSKEVVYVAVGNKKQKISYHLKKVASQTIRINQDFINEVKL